MKEKKDENRRLTEADGKCADAKAAAAYFADKKFVTNLVFPKIKP